MKPKRGEHPFDYNFRTATDYRARRPLFNDMDRLRGIGNLVDYTIGEVDEAYEEVNRVDGYDPTKVIDELNDIYNMWVSITTAVHGPTFVPSHYLDFVNGDGEHSNVFDRLRGTIEDIKDDSRAIVASLELLWSIAQFAVDRDTSRMTVDIYATYQKVSNNYPTEFYTGNDPVTGTALNEEQKEQVFSHATKGLKLIRAKEQRTLQASDIPPYRAHLVDWQNSEEALTAIRNKLDSTPRPLETANNTIVVPTPEVTISITQNSGILFPQLR